MKLCSAYDDVHKVTCDRAIGHDGEHQATVIWSDRDKDTNEEA